MTFSTENWHSTYLCPGERLANFFYVSLFSSYEPVRYRRTDGRTGKTRNVACKTVASVADSWARPRGAQLQLGTLSTLIALYTRRWCASSGVLTRGGATILRVRGTNITASEASRNFFGLYPHICHSGGTTATNRGIRRAYRTALLQYLTGSSCSYNFSQYLNTFQIPDAVFKYFSI